MKHQEAGESSKNMAVIASNTDKNDQLGIQFLYLQVILGLTYLNARLICRLHFLGIPS